MFYKSSKSLGYTKNITSEKDFIEFIDRIQLEQSMVNDLKINNKSYPVSDLTPIFEKVKQLQKEEAI
ncbi:hypothetical protein [Metabacillus niabensis]|uniref:Uncharacterized protein n=1 Tax=Metabacillus niabensis TaxID=324854 RepID=A0ABT9Z845_9BACI|nr:hypothetical protein [Metabacillus niabensis]MDQ0228443.1 hypothetical protein [Metabacillus niabensis]